MYISVPCVRDLVSSCSSYFFIYVFR